MNTRSLCRKTKLGSIVSLRVVVVLMSMGVILAFSPASTSASVKPSTAKAPVSAPSAGEGSSSLEAVASKASETGRKVAMSLLGLAFAVAGVVLAFRRDFREAVGVFAVGFVAVLLVTPAGLSLLQDTVNTLLGVQ
jgi:hypothetical protein